MIRTLPSTLKVKRYVCLLRSALNCDSVFADLTEASRLAVAVRPLPDLNM